MLLPRDIPVIVPTLLALPSLVYASFECSHIVADRQVFNLKPLGGPHVVHVIKENPPSITNLTFTVDICQSLERHKGVSKEHECPMGTRVCGIEYDYDTSDGTQFVKEVIPIAGNFKGSTGKDLDPHFTRLKDSPLNPDSDKEGIVIELGGGKYPLNSSGKPQKAIIEFVCDPERTGLGGDETDKREKAERDTEETPEEGEPVDGGDGDGDDNKEDPKKDLVFLSYKDEGSKTTTGVLRLKWSTKYACESQPDDGKGDDTDKPTSGHWGFFTWFIIILFLAVAAYLIFGSWLNYNRYGARGWDLVPHGDTIRDMPYLMKDWGRRVVGTVSGGGSRGGYSAV